MNAVEPRLRRSYFLRQVFLGAVFGGIGLVILLLGRKSLGVLGPVAAIMGFGSWMAVMLREYFLGAGKLDVSGATRRDGRHFPWADLKQKNYVRGRLPSGQLGPLNHVDLVFASGTVRILPFTIENAADVMKFLEDMEGGKPGQSPAEATDEGGRHRSCRICSELGDYERGFQKGGREAEDTRIPAAAGALTDVKEIKPGFNRTPVLQRCPECGTCYLYKVDYEFLVSGSEDEQVLIRLTDQEAAAYLDPPKE